MMGGLLSSAGIIRRLICSVALHAGTFVNFTDPANADTLCGLGFESPEQIREDISKGPRTKLVTDNEASIQLIDGQNLVIWTILKAAHPASPAVICQTPVIEDGATVLLLQARCGGPKSQCDALIAEFEVHQKETARRLSEGSPPHKP